MGGRGSGNHWPSGSKSTTEGSFSIDVRKLKRQGFLVPGAGRRSGWSRGEEEIASINFDVEPGRLILNYQHKSGGTDWEDRSYPVYLTTTPCNIGGERHWFCCPVPSCGKRVAVLYGGRYFACRTCHKLAYSSQREDEADRARRKADRIRDRLGWPRGLWNGSHWGKPHGMHWSTYERLRAQHYGLEAIVNGAFIARATALFPFIGRRL
jgi:hypothetical protein